MYAQVRHMRIVAAKRRKGSSSIGDSDWYDVELTDSRNILYLNDVAINAGPVRVGQVYKVTVEPATAETDCC